MESGARCGGVCCRTAGSEKHASEGNEERQRLFRQNQSFHFTFELFRVFEFAESYSRSCHAPSCEDGRTRKCQTTSTSPVAQSIFSVWVVKELQRCRDPWFARIPPYLLTLNAKSR
jgi:hypothetical protein